MNRIFLILIIFSLAAAGRAQTTGSRTIKPAGAPKRIATVIDGKVRNYYALSTTESSVVAVEGPGILKIHTRAQFRTGEGESLRYTLLYRIDGGVQASTDITGISRSSKAAYQDVALGVPGELHTFEIELPRGSHTVDIRLKDLTNNVAARYTFTASKPKKQDWMAYSPVLPSEPVDLVSKESTTVYYRFSAGKPLRVEVYGPTELRVLTRTENHYQMKGRINYRVQVRENGAVINTYQLSSSVSEMATYKEVKDLVPGTACEFVIFVPKGKHTYEIVPLDQDKRSLLGRLLIPEKDVRLEEN